MKNRPNLHLGKSIGNFDRCIIDVGSCDTGYRGKFFKSKFHLPVLFIDADQVALHNLQVSADDLIINAAISSRNGIGKFNIYKHQGTSSLCEIDRNNATSWKIGNTNSTQDDWKCQEVNLVPMITLSDIIETLQIQEIVALKIDTQGHDFEVIRGLGHHFGKVNYIELEVQIVPNELYKNSSKKDEVISFLTDKGFNLVHEDYQSQDQEQNLYFLQKGKNI